jgi:hypothetical protein
MFWLIAPFLLFIYFFYRNKKNNTEAMLKIIYDGEEVANYTFKEFSNKKKYITYDFILYSIPVEDDNYVLRYDDADDILAVEYTSLKCIELTDVQIRVNDIETYTIDFGRNQYFINGNVLFDRKFLKWYLNMFCGIHLAEEDKYRITFNDPEKKSINLPDYCYLLIKRNNYIIVNFKRI